MRRPSGVAVGTIRPVMLSGISRLQAQGSPKIACILAGIPEPAIEDVKITDLIVVNRRGGDQQRRRVELGRIKVPVKEGIPTLRLSNVRDFAVYRSRPVWDAEVTVAHKKDI